MNNNAHTLITIKLYIYIYIFKVRYMFLCECIKLVGMWGQDDLVRRME